MWILSPAGPHTHSKINGSHRGLLSIRAERSAAFGKREYATSCLSHSLSPSLNPTCLLRNVTCLHVCKKKKEKSVRDDLETQSTKVLQWQITASCLSDVRGWECVRVNVCERATETGNVKRRRGDSYTSLSLLFSSVNLEKIFSLSDLRERRDEEEGGERETMKSRETHMERQHRERK